MNLLIACFLICTLVHRNVAEDTVTFKNVSVIFVDVFYRYRRFIISYSNDLQKEIKQQISKNPYCKDYPAHIFIQNQSIPVIYRNTLNNVEAASLEIGNCEVEEIQPGSFKNLSVLNLIFVHNKLQTVKRDVFQDLPDLWILDLTGNGIRYIEKGSFERGNRLILSQNDLEEIPEGAFNNITINFLHLDGNKIRKIPKEAFTNSSIGEITLKNNLIETIEPGAFGPSIRGIDLQSNFLTKITSGIFSRFSAECSLDFHNNTIQYIEPGAFENSSFLCIDLSQNSLVEIKNETFSGSSVSVLNFSNNKIKDIEGGAFANVLRGVDLSKNNLKTIRKGTFRMCGFLPYVNLEDNAIAVIEEGAFNTCYLQLALNEANLDADSKIYLNNLMGDRRVYLVRFTF